MLIKIQEKRLWQQNNNKNRTRGARNDKTGITLKVQQPSTINNLSMNFPLAPRVGYGGDELRNDGIWYITLPGSSIRVPAYPAPNVQDLVYIPPQLYHNSCPVIYIASLPAASHIFLGLGTGPNSLRVETGKWLAPSYSAMMHYERAAGMYVSFSYDFFRIHRRRDRDRRFQRCCQGISSSF